MKALFVCAAGCNRSHALALNSKMMWSWDSPRCGYLGKSNRLPHALRLG